MEVGMRTLVVNVGSSSVKLRLLDEGTAVQALDCGALDDRALGEAIAGFVGAHPDIDAAGHRVVHGGPGFGSSVEITAETERRLSDLKDLAPLHNPRALAGIDAVRELRPRLRQVACFDTGFHRDLPDHSATYALPAEWRRRYVLRRYGFHGLSHSWASRRGAALLGRPVEDLRLVTAHLGSGASLAAVAGGRSVDTTMGCTPLEGLVMSTRAGSVDPGMLLWLERTAGLDPAQVEDGLEHGSGLLGLSEKSGDMREVMAAAAEGDARAELAYGVYVHRLRTSIGAMTAAMGGIDAIVFTGGAGEGSSQLRADACDGLAFLGIQIDAGRNEGTTDDAVVSAGSGLPAVLVVASREDLEIERLVREVLEPAEQAGA
jgi:acetate kinase